MKKGAGSPTLVYYTKDLFISLFLVLMVLLIKKGNPSSKIWYFHYYAFIMIYIYIYYKKRVSRTCITHLEKAFILNIGKHASRKEWLVVNLIKYFSFLFLGL